MTLSADVKRKYVKVTLLAAGLLLSAAWHYSTKLLLPWSLDAVPLFACFMASGEILREKKQEKLLGELWVLGLLLVAFLVSSQLNGSMNLSSGNYGHSVLLCLTSGITGSLLVFAAGMWLQKKYPPFIRLCSLAGRGDADRPLLSYVFVHVHPDRRISAGLPAVLTQFLLVGGSMATLTGAGWFWHKNMKR